MGSTQRLTTKRSSHRVARGALTGAVTYGGGITEPAHRNWYTKMQIVHCSSDSQTFSVFSSNVIIHVVFLLTIACLSLQRANASWETPIVDHEKQVRDFVAAFNSRDLAKMLEFTDDNIQWLSVNGAKISIETEGKAALKASMEKYFDGCPSCKSSLESVQTVGSRVTAKETASWTGKNGPREQSSLSVYEFQNNKIIRVYYFPVETETASRK